MPLMIEDSEDHFDPFDLQEYPYECLSLTYPVNNNNIWINVINNNIWIVYFSISICYSNDAVSECILEGRKDYRLESGCI